VHPAHPHPAPLSPVALDGLDPLSGRLFQSWMGALAAHRQLMARAFAEHESHPGQAICLRILADHDGMSQRELAHALRLSPPTVTAMLKRLERAGTVERRPDAADGRVTRVHLTELGREREHAARKVLVGALGAVLESLSEQDRAELARLLDLVAEHAREVAR
jgi:MarR family transcriptional regulator, organic hydroperoxide resistance regulator